MIREEALYLAGAADLLKLVQATGPRVTHLMIVGHNPGVSELAHLLVPAGGSAGLATAALCSITFECAAWDGDRARATVRDVTRAAARRGTLQPVFLTPLRRLSTPAR